LLSLSRDVLIKDLARVAQLIERHLAKVEVAGLNPVSRSEKYIYQFSIVILKLEWWNW
jgi:hypothetical protein